MHVANDARGRLYEIAEEQGVRVVSFPLPECRSIAMPLASGAVVGIDCSAPMTHAEETVCLAHELGHCATGSFYSRKTPFETRERCERRADVWCIRRLIPPQTLRRLLREGRDADEIAEILGVTEDCVVKAYYYYKDACGERF